MTTDSAAIETGATGIVKLRGPLVTLVAICFIAAIVFPAFLTPVNLANVLRQVSMYGLLSIGMAFVILSGGIDLSVGSIVAVASILAVQLAGWFGPAAVLVPILAGVAIGAVNGALVTWVKLPPFIATLAMMLGVRGLAFIIAGDRATAGNAGQAEPVPAWFSEIARGDVLGMPYPAIILILALAAAIVVSNYTSFGRSVYAVGGSEEAARMMGLNVNKAKILVYMICGGCAGAAGLLLAFKVKAMETNAALGWELVAIAAVVIGGISLTGGVGKIGHAMYGVLIIGIISNLINHLRIRFGISLPPWYNEMITGMLLLAVVLLQSRMKARDS
jgi:ribose/xylose/arabinose/galactoside ABC-type transport system permease subunit